MPPWAKKQKALEYFNQSLPIRRAVGDRQGEAITLSDIGYSYTSSDEHLKAMDYYNHALSLARAVEDRSVEASTLQRMSLIERDRGNLVEARKKIEAALDIVESLRTKVASQELRASYFASAQHYFETYIDILMQLHKHEPGSGYDSNAFQAGERARARSLLEMLTEAGANIREGIDPELLQKERSLRQLLNAKAAAQSRLIQTQENAAEMSALSEQIKVLLTQHQEVEGQIRVSSPRYAALMQPQPLTLREIQQQILDKDTLLLAYSLGTDRSYLWMVTSSSLKSAELPPRQEVETATRRVYELLTARQQWLRFETAAERQKRTLSADVEYLTRATALSQILLGPAVAHLGRGGKKRLLIVSDGALNYLPFAALPIAEAVTGDRPLRPPSSFVPLIVEHEIVGLPSASVLGMLRRETAGRKRAPKTLAVLADPVFESNDLRLKKGASPTRRPTRGLDTAFKGELREGLRSAVFQDPDESVGQNFQRLMFTRQEANEILSLVLPSERLSALGFEANLAAAINPELGHYRFIHFATHGIVDSARPELSGIVLSLFNREGVVQDGFLRVNEIFNLKLPVDLVVLSGCRTGLGKEIKGEGLIGLTRGFMYAGAARVMVSLWDVSDEASARLMVQFYRGMLEDRRLSPSAALRAAQIALWKQQRWRAPYYWAAFVIQGEPG